MRKMKRKKVVEKSRREMFIGTGISAIGRNNEHLPVDLPENRNNIYM